MCVRICVWGVCVTGLCVCVCVCSLRGVCMRVGDLTLVLCRAAVIPPPSFACPTRVAAC
ncbi:MAG: hypothetical protein P4L40_13795 [Terracidiphilus sp.]|nr:hypothetical protein [Terracidiphilus sp.]